MELKTAMVVSMIDKVKPNIPAWMLYAFKNKNNILIIMTIIETFMIPRGRINERSYLNFSLKSKTFAIT